MLWKLENLFQEVHGFILMKRLVICTKRRESVPTRLEFKRWVPSRFQAWRVDCKFGRRWQRALLLLSQYTTMTEKGFRHLGYNLWTSILMIVVIARLLELQFAKIFRLFSKFWGYISASIRYYGVQYLHNSNTFLTNASAISIALSVFVRRGNWSIIVVMALEPLEISGKCVMKSISIAS